MSGAVAQGGRHLSDGARRPRLTGLCLFLNVKNHVLISLSLRLYQCYSLCLYPSGLLHKLDATCRTEPDVPNKKGCLFLYLVALSPSFSAAVLLWIHLFRDEDPEFFSTDPDPAQLKKNSGSDLKSK